MTRRGFVKHQLDWRHCYVHIRNPFSSQVPFDENLATESLANVDRTEIMPPEVGHGLRRLLRVHCEGPALVFAAVVVWSTIVERHGTGSVRFAGVVHVPLLSSTYCKCRLPCQRDARGA